MIQLSSLNKHYQGRYLFRSVNWQVRDDERVGLCGPNGSGKTTLLRMLAGEVAPDDGLIAIPKGTTIGYLPQDGLHAEGRALFEEMRCAFAGLLELEKEQSELERYLATAPSSTPTYIEATERYGEVEAAFREQGGFEIERKVAGVLSGLGFSQDDFDKDCGHFSGGWQMRIALGKLLLAQPNLLLLDEPTNHLDIEARAWLQRFLQTYPNSVILVSHDRYFLDAVVHKITEVSPQGLLDFTGGYSGYLEKREAFYERIRKHNEGLLQEIKRLTDLADRFGAKATKASQAQGWRKQAEKLQAELLPDPPGKETIHFRFPDAPHSGKITLRADGLSKAYGENRVLRDVKFIIARGERVALIGVNGAGKSTLMRILAGQEEHAGEVELGHQVSPAFFAQDQAGTLDSAKTVWEEATATAPSEMIPRLRGLLGAFLLRGNDVEKPISVLSGGERNRLALVKLLLRPANLLLLDEPTNHLDIDSKDILLEALQAFKGTIVFVSHDRYFVEHLADRVLHVHDGTADDHPGSYLEFLEKEKLSEASAPTSANTAGDNGDGSPEYDEKAERIAERQAKKALEKEKRIMERRLETNEAAVAQAEKDLVAVERKLSDPACYADPDQAAALAEEHRLAKEGLETLMSEWEALQLAYEQLEIHA